jgi:hypothetical protein
MIHGILDIDVRDTDSEDQLDWESNLVPLLYQSDILPAGPPKSIPTVHRPSYYFQNCFCLQLKDTTQIFWSMAGKSAMLRWPAAPNGMYSKAKST